MHGIVADLTSKKLMKNYPEKIAFCTKKVYD